MLFEILTFETVNALNTIITNKDFQCVDSLTNANRENLFEILNGFFIRYDYDL